MSQEKSPQADETSPSGVKVNFDRVHQEHEMEKKTWEYEKLSVRLSEAYGKMDLLYDAKKVICYPFLALSSVFKVLYIFLKKFMACFGILHQYFEEESEDDFVDTGKTYKGRKVLKEKSDTQKCLDCLLTTITGAIFFAFLIVTCVCWVLSNMFLYMSFIWCFTTDLEFESDHYYKIAAEREKFLHYQLKIKSGQNKPADWKERQQKKLERSEEKIKRMIENKRKMDERRYGHASVQSLNNEVQGSDLHNIPNVLTHLLIVSQVEINRIIKEDAKDDDRVKKCKLSLMDEFPNKSAAEIMEMAEERYREIRFEELKDKRTAMAISLSRRFLSALQDGSVSKDALFAMVRDKMDYSVIDEALKNVKITNIKDFGKVIDTSNLFSSSRCSADHVGLVLSVDLNGDPAEEC